MHLKPKGFLTILLIVILFATTILSGCNTLRTCHWQPPTDAFATQEASSQKNAYTFTDALGREITIGDTNRVGIASGSFAECWLLAGGTPYAVTQDALTERNLHLPDDVVNLGSLVHPSMEIILDSELDLLILVSTVKTHLELADTLDQAGIPYAYLNIETFDDYLNILKIFTDITGRSDLYEQNGLAIKKQIDDVIANNQQKDAPKVLVLRSSSSKITARNSETMVGQMIKNLGCINIADQDDSLLETLSLESIAAANPEYIFVICRGDETEAKASLENLLASNQIWSTLDAVKNNHVYYLGKELFHYKPTVKWGESYEVLANIFAEN